MYDTETSATGCYTAHDLCLKVLRVCCIGNVHVAPKDFGGLIPSSSTLNVFCPQTEDYIGLEINPIMLPKTT